MKFQLAVLLVFMGLGPVSALDVVPINTDGPGVNLPPGAVFDILGLQPGSTIEEARDVIGKSSPLEPRETTLAGTLSRAGEGSLEVSFVQQIQSIDTVGSAYLTVPSDRLRVVLASKLYDQRVLMVQRDVVYAKDIGLSAKDLQDQIVAKYGKPSMVQSDDQGWASRIVYAYGPEGLLTGLEGMEWGMWASRVNDDAMTEYYSPEAPCQMAVSAAQQMAEAEITDRASVAYEDPACVAVFQVELQNRNGFVTTATFKSIDQKRALDYGKALIETIDKTLSSTKSVGPQQQL